MAQTRSKAQARREKAAAAREQTRRRERRRRVGLPAAVLAGVLLVAGGLVWWNAGRETDPAQAERPVDWFMHVHGLEITGWASDEVYVSTHQGLIRIDAAGEWRYISEESHDFMGFSAHPTEDGVLYSSGHPAAGSRLQNPIGFMVSTDGGVSWEPRSLLGETDFHAMAVAPSDGDVVYGYNVAGQIGLYVSTDAGQSWDTITDGLLDQAGGALSLAVHPNDPDEVWAGTQAGLLVSTDAGQSWEPLLTGAITAVAFDPGDPDRVVAYAADARGLIETRDAGETWAELGLVVDEDAAGHIAIHPTDPATLYIGTHGEDLLRSSDGGSTWETLAEDGVPAR